MGRLGYSRRLALEFVRLARQQRAYWILPLVLLLGGAAILVVASGAATPLIYALF